MKSFSNLPEKDKNKIYINLKEIAEYNRQRFFSSEFLNQVTTELVENIQSALYQVKKTRLTQH